MSIIATSANQSCAVKSPFGAPPSRICSLVSQKAPMPPSIWSMFMYMPSVNHHTMLNTQISFMSGTQDDDGVAMKEYRPRYRPILVATTTLRPKGTMYESCARQPATAGASSQSSGFGDMIA